MRIFAGLPMPISPPHSANVCASPEAIRSMSERVIPGILSYTDLHNGLKKVMLTKSVQSSARAQIDRPLVNGL